MSKFPGGLTEADIDFQGVALIVKFYSVAMNQLLAFLISKRSPKVLFPFSCHNHGGNS